MIPFDSLTLKAFVAENKEFLSGARIQKIQQPTRRDFILFIRKFGVSKKLYININPQLHHICFMSKDNESKRHIEIPSKPPMFCMLLRKYLENAVISKVVQPEYERILEFYIETFNELNEKIYLCLTVELMGKHSNVILYNYDTNIILGCAHNVGAEKSREREVSGTLPYAYPPKQNKLDIQNFNGIIDYNTLSNEFYFFSTYFAKLVKGKTLEELKNYAALKNIQPALNSDYSSYSLYSELLTTPILQNSVNDMIDNYYANCQEIHKFQALKTHLQTITNQKLRRTNSALNKMSSQIEREENCDKYRLWGDLIMANLYSSKDYSSEIKLYDWENNKEVTVTLDSSKTLKENANHYYKLYNKGKTSKQKLTQLKDELSQIKIYLEQLNYSIDTSKSYEELLEIKPELQEDKNEKKEKHKAIEPKKIIHGDFTIYIGKNNRQNDYIVSKLSKDDDLWFHTRDCAGSHILLKGKNPPENLILECAKLAKEYSSASNSTKVSVIYTNCKYLKKPPKANLGYVTYKNEKEIIID